MYIVSCVNQKSLNLQLYADCLFQVEVTRRPWTYVDTDGQQVGGFVKEFDNIAFLTVKVKPAMSQQRNINMSQPITYQHFFTNTVTNIDPENGLVLPATAPTHVTLTRCLTFALLCRVLVTWFHQTNLSQPSPCSPDSSRDSHTDL